MAFKEILVTLNDDDKSSHNRLILDKDLESLILQKLQEQKSVTTTGLEAELKHFELILEKTGGTLTAVDGHIVLQDHMLAVIGVTSKQKSRRQPPGARLKMALNKKKTHSGVAAG
jgi:CelD/BcsL family acetyltransferase involved in cellulose biosynthesis